MEILLLNQKGLEKLIDIHDLIFIAKLNDYSIIIVDINRLGKNFASSSKEISMRNHYCLCIFECNSFCSETNRYLCLSCSQGYIHKDMVVYAKNVWTF